MMTQPECMMTQPTGHLLNPTLFLHHYSVQPPNALY
jgi:hypothetical protein